jgi:hypothetical protein
MSKSFALAVAEANGAVEDALPFQMEGDDTQLYAYPPGEGQLVLLMGLTGNQNPVALASTVLDVFWELMTEDTARVLKRRLNDRSDPFGIQDVMHIIEWLIEEVTGRPTQSSSASTPSRTTSGRRSTATARQRASTRSTSPRAASAT